MRLLIFTENSHRGGLDTFLATLIEHWPSAEDEIILVCNAGHPGLADIEARVTRPCRFVGHRLAMQWALMNRFERLPLIGRLRRLVSPFLRYPFFLYYVMALRRLLAQFGADRLIIANGGYPGGDSCRAAALAWRGSGQGRAVMCVHSMAIAPRPWERWIENRIDAAVIRRLGALTSVSDACVAAFARRPGFAGNWRLLRIYNGVVPPVPVADDTSSAVRRALTIAEDAPLCLMLGSYEPHKGHDFLLRAFARVVRRLPAARLVICGHGYDREVARVRGMVEAAGLADCVRLEPFRTDRDAMMAAADIIVLPSQAFEAFGLTAVEAWAGGRAVVATDMGGLVEVMGGRGETEGGFCIAHDDDEAFADAVLRLAGDRDLRRAKAEGGRRRYRALFTAGRMAADYAALVSAPAAEGNSPA